MAKVFMIRENTFNPKCFGFFVTDENTCNDQLVASETTFVDGDKLRDDNFRNHKTRREAIRHLKQVVKGKLVKKSKNIYHLI